MPANNRDYSFFGEWPKDSENIYSGFSNNISLASQHSSKNSSPSSSATSSPISGSPPTSGGFSTLLRNYSSTFTLIPEDREIDIVRRMSKGSESTSSEDTETEPITDDEDEDDDIFKSLLMRIIDIVLWWPKTLIKICFTILGYILRLVLVPFSFAAPSFWLSALLWIFWKTIRFPISTIKWLFVSLTDYDDDDAYDNKDNNRPNKKRTVLISCGSTIQTLHLARNFYSSGVRVVVFEFEGLFGLARFSTAVNKFYTVPRPTANSADEYIAALCDIVEKEKPAMYVPVCATSPSTYDSLAKPHLELLGCASFIPGMQENSILDDTFEIYKKCKANDIPVPPSKLLSSKDDLISLYASGFLNGFRNIIMSIGLQGLLERQKYIVPTNQRDLRLNYEINEKHQWLIIRDVPGDHFVTCTTVKDSRIVANVTCLVNQETKNLIPEDNKNIDNWLENFFAKVRFQRPINSHISFRFVRNQNTSEILPLGSRVGVSLPYICYTGVHSRVLWKPCPHFRRTNSGPIIEEAGRYWIHETILNTLKHPSLNAVEKLIGTVLDKREALFAYWDPLPYCAYYHFQLPLKSVKIFLQNRQKTRSLANGMGVPVQ